VWKLRQSPTRGKNLVRPREWRIGGGSGGWLSTRGTLRIVALAEKIQPDLTIVETELPLVNGLTDAYLGAKFGPL